MKHAALALAGCEHVRGWPVADILAAIRAELPQLDEGLVALVADWLTSDAPGPVPPLDPVPRLGDPTRSQRQAQ